MRVRIRLPTAQVEAVVQGIMTQQAATIQGGVRSSVSLVDAKLVTKQNVFSGKQDEKGRWRTWSFKMRACCAAHATKLYHILSVSMDGEALDTGRTRPVTNGMKMWRWMVTRWEPIVIFRL